MSQHASLTYRPEIDGLRTIAVLPVLLFHVGLGCPGGYVGVDVFFVISGFLIGSLVIKEVERGTFSLVNFWERRVRRLFPALAVVVIASSIAAWIWMIPDHLAEFGQSVVAQPLMISNFYFWRQSGYFETAAEFQPLLHTWSLAVEEQFYLFFPILMLFFMKRGRAFTIGMIIAFIVGSFIWSVIGTHQYPSFAFFLIPSRIWELDLGVMLALLPSLSRLSKPLSECLGWIGLALIAVGVFGFDINTPFPGWTAAIPCLGAVLIILSNSSDLNGVGKLLSLKPMVFIGKISYSLYLWHWPVIVFLKYVLIVEITLAHSLAALASSFLLAWLTWKFIENPFRTKSVLSGRWKLFGASAVISAALIGTGAYFYFERGLPNRFPPEVTKWVPEGHPLGELTGLHQLYTEGTLPEIGTPAAEDPNGKILLWGDSHSMSMLPVLEDLAKEYNVTLFAATQPGVAPIPFTYGHRWAPEMEDQTGEEVVDFISENGITDIILIARWHLYTLGTESGELRYILSDSETKSNTLAQGQEVFIKNLQRGLKHWEEAGVRVWIMEDVATQNRSVPGTLAQAASRGLDTNSFARTAEEVQETNHAVKAILDRATTGFPVQYIDPLPYFYDPSGIYLVEKDGKTLYNDAHHISPYASRMLKPLLIPLFESATDQPATR